MSSKALKPADYLPAPDFPEEHSHFGKPRCQAWNPNQGRQCLGIAMAGTSKCRVHGGASPKGPASGRWETGRWSVYVPGELLEKYRQALNDPELLDRAADIALIDTRIAGLVEELESVMEDGHTWSDALQVFVQFEEAYAQGDTAKASRALSKLKIVLQGGYDKGRQWEKIEDALQRRSQLVSAQEARLVKMGLMLALEDQMAIIERLANIVKEAVSAHVDDRNAKKQILGAITKDLRQILH